MDTTQNPVPESGAPSDAQTAQALLDELAAVDPADAPRSAERLAAVLTDQLERTGVDDRDPEQLRADLDTPAEERSL